MTTSTETPPVESAPTEVDSVKAEPVNADPVKTDPMDTEPVPTGSIKPELVRPEPIKPEPIKPVPIRIDFVSDVTCPWCAIGLKSLERALERIGNRIQVDLRFQPFELNPQMPPEGKDAAEHLMQKYGTTLEQLERNRDTIRARGAELGFVFNERKRVYNTFDAHRLLHWAALEGCAHALKSALLRAYLTDGEDVSSTETLVRIAEEVGLDRQRAQRILSTDIYAGDVRAQELHYTQRGIHSVPSVIINRRHLIQGGQPVETFENALWKIAGLGESNPATT